MRWLLALGAAVIVVLLLELVAQLTLPGIAADHVRDQLQKDGRVLAVEVKAFPALKLIAHKADTVTVRMASYRSGTSRLTSLLEESDDVGTLRASAGTFTDGLLTLHDATLTKRGDTLTGTAQVHESDLTHAIPLIKSVTPVASSGGTLTLEGTAAIAGFEGTVLFTVRASNGALIAAPDLPILSAFRITLFSNPHLAIDSVSARATKGGFEVTARGHLR